jgi:hypothetical protein
MSTYTPIATQTLGSAAASVTFSSIPQGYTDLVVVANRLSVGLDNLTMQFNGDTSTNYSFTNMWGNGSTAGSARGSNTATPYLDYYAASEPSFPAPVIMNIQNYSNSTTYKTTLARGSNAARGVDATVMLWRSTAPITSILLKCYSSTNFTTGSTFSIYGIQVGNAAQKAQGGNIVTSDGTYMYHAFTSSGSFIPNQALTADVLVIAGGGGGSASKGTSNSQNPSSGGAGGGFLSGSMSLAVSNYPITIGAGGTGGVGDAVAGASGSNSVFNGATALGGGGGVPGNQNVGIAGGSGSGGAGTQVGGSATQGNSGGLTGYGFGGGTGGGTASGGSGGAGGAGGNGGGGSNGTNGGAAKSSTFSGTTQYYSGGGGGGAYYSTGSETGGTGGTNAGNGASGQSGAQSGTNAVANFGGGGGGAGTISGAVATGSGGNGGSGIVIIRYAL